MSAVNRWLRELDFGQSVIDLAIFFTTITLFASNEKVAMFHLIFLLLIITAFRLTLVPLLLRAIPAGTAVVIALFMAWADDLVPVDELFELPILSAMIVVVYLTSSRRQRLTGEIEEQRATIDALHRAARTELQDQLLLSQRLQVTNRLNSTVVHDVNNILAGMQIAAETLTDRAHDETYVNATGAEIEKYTEQAAQIIKELLASARMVNNLTPQPGADVAEALIEFEPLLRRLCGKRIELTIEGTDIDACVELPTLRLEQILANLVANAVDALSNVDGSIRIVASINDDTVLLTVSDTGKGIVDSELEKVFDPYFTTKEDKERSGLGLFSVRELVTDEGGTIEVESDVGKGTTFTICLPISVGADKASTNADDSPDRSRPVHRAGRRHALRLLLADDDEIYRNSLAEALRAAGHQVTTAIDGDDAYNQFNGGAASFDVVISDVVMPGRSGVDLAGDIARMSPHTPVLLITGHEQIRFDHRIARHATPVRQKPFATADLLTDLQLLGESIST